MIETETLAQSRAPRLKWLAGGGTTTRLILVAMATVALVTMGVRVVAIARELVVAREFGVSNALDAYLMAYAVPGFAVSVVASSLNAALIPTYIQVRSRKGSDEAQRLVSTVVVVSSAILIALSLVLAVVIPLVLPAMAPGFSPEKIDLTRRLFYVMLPLVTFTGLATTWAAVLNAGERFALVAVVPILTPMVVMLLVILFAQSWGAYAIAVGALIGSALEATALAAMLRRHGIAPWPKWSGLSPEVRMVIRQYAPAAMSALLMSSALLTDQIMAAGLKTGSVSMLNYGSRLTTLVVSVSALAVGTAVLPYFSRLVAAQDWTGLRAALRVNVAVVFLVSLPVALALSLLARPIIELVLQRGAFTAHDTREVARVQALFALQIPFYGASIVVVRLIAALRANVLLAWGAALNVVVNVGLNYAFSRWIGVAGIALSTTCVYIVSFVFVSFALRRRLRAVTA